MNKFMSNLAENIELYLSFKHSSGFIYRTGEYYLHDFDKYNLENGNYDYLNQRLVESWVQQKKKQTNSQYFGFMSYIREFGRYLNSIDDRSYVLNDNYKAVRYKANVYLFTNDELHRFFQQIEYYRKTANNIRESMVMPAVFRFLYWIGYTKLDSF